MTPIMLSFSDGSSGECRLENKRGVWDTELPDTVMVRKSDDTLRFKCESEDGREAVGGIPSRMGAKIIASAVFIDFGITDAITDKHREYPTSVVIPLPKVQGEGSTVAELETKPLEVSTKKRTKVFDIADSMECTDAVTLVERKTESEIWRLECGDGESITVRCFDDDCYTKTP